MRKRLVSGAIAILVLGSVATPAFADHGGDNGHRGRGHGGEENENRHKVNNVKLRDNCDPATFDAVFGAGTCVPHGNLPNVTLPEFFAKLNPVDFGHPQWNNKPTMLEIDQDESLKVVVKGGEFHTFTEVPAFGPGCVGPINDALQLTGPAPTEAECGAFFATTGVAANGGSTLRVTGLSPGTHLFMCEIHPWMRTTVKVEAEHEHEDDD